MSEAHTPEAEAASTETDFEAARVAEEADTGAEEANGEGEGEGEPEAKAVDWQKRAMDKEGQAAKERARRRETERQNRELAARVERLEAAKPKADQGDDILSLIKAIPEGDDDPIGKMEAMERALKAFARQQETEGEQEGRAEAVKREIGKLVSAMDEAEGDFRDEHPDYDEAMKHFKTARRSDFEDMGYAGRELENALAEDLLGLVRRAVTGGRDPAEVAYNLAKKRGFQSGQTATNEKLKEIAAAAAAGKGAGAGGSKGSGAMSVDALNKLKGAAYDAAFKKYSDEMRRAS